MKDVHQIAIIGAYGGAGKAIAKALLEHTEVDLILAGRNKLKLDQFFDEISSKTNLKRIQKSYLDVREHDQLQSVMSKADLAIITINNPRLITDVIKCAIDTQTDVLDIFVGSSVIDHINEFKNEIDQKEILIITQAGFHPGLPAPFVRYGARKFDEINTANIATAMHTVFESADAATEIFDELSTDKNSILEKGSWRKAKFSDLKDFEFGLGFGKKECYPLTMTELFPLENELGIKNMALYAAGFNKYVDYFVFPFAMLLQKINKKLGTKIGSILTYKSLKRNYTGTPKIEFRMEASGIKSGKQKVFKIIAQYDDGYIFTALAVIACIKQYLSGLLPLKGIHHMGLIVDPYLLIKQLKEMGIEIIEEC